MPVLIALALFIREMWRRFRERADDTRTYWLRAGAVTGLCAIAVQELSDFTLQMPGAAYAVFSSHAEGKSGGGPDSSEEVAAVYLGRWSPITIEKLPDGLRNTPITPCRFVPYVGPMISEREATRAENWVREAVAAGARLVEGGRRDGGWDRADSH